MNKIELPKVNLAIYSEKLANGLDVYIVPKPNVSNTYVMFTTKFGSMHASFMKDNETINIPSGTAHFLEHKVFEANNGISPFEYYTQRGADSNASTSNYRTSYYFSGNQDIEGCINFLLDCVNEAKFTDESVEKEKGIIEQEIKMYDDLPYQKINDLLLFNSFHKHPIRYAIGGTVESIHSITKETLYDCYNTFYQPSNMFLVIVGDVDNEQMLNLVKTNQEKRKNKSNAKIELSPVDEPDTVFKKKDITKMNIVVPKIAVSFKINIEKFNNFNIGDLINYLSIYFNNKYGYISEFSEEMKRNGLINSAIEVSILYTDKHILVSLFMDSKQGDTIIKKIIEETKVRNVKESDVERAKKIIKSSYIYMSDSIYGIGNSIVDQIIRYDKLIGDGLALADRYNFKDYQYIINNISLKNYQITIIEPK